MKKYISVLSVLFLINYINSAQTKPCASLPSSQFDFWIGDWKCLWKDTDGSIKKGSNSVKKILNSCVIEENLTGVLVLN